MIVYAERGQYEIWPINRRGRIADVRLRTGEDTSVVVGTLNELAYRSYILSLKGLRFQDGLVRPAPAGEGKHFPSVENVLRYLEQDIIHTLVLQAYERRKSNK